MKPWKDTPEIKFINLAELLEVLHSAKHCRQSAYLKEYSQFWLNLLNQYIQFEITPEKYKQKAIYEFLWLSLRPVWLKNSEGTLIGKNQLIEQYFSKLREFDDHESFENHFNLLQIVRATIKSGKCDLDSKKTGEWNTEINSFIKNKVESIDNPNEVCYWLELQVDILSNPLDFKGKVSENDKLYQTYSKLIELLPKAPLYNVTRLNDRINQLIEIYIHVGNREDFVDLLESIADKLMPYVSEKHGKYKLAKTYVDRGVKYLHTSNTLHIAKALDNFHKAKKDLWLQEETAEGYVLALLNISQIYSAMSMNQAAKYYALGAAWFSINNNPEKLARRIANAFGMIVYCDYKQGSWFSALVSFEYYIGARINFDGRPLDEADKLLIKSFINVASILTISPRVSMQLRGYIEFQKQQMGHIYKDFIEPLIAEYEGLLEKDGLQTHIQNSLDAAPLNDIGTNRIIEWKTFGSVWSVSFPNNWICNSLGEEFAAILQILLVELSGSSIDLHFIRTKIEIEIAESEILKLPEQLPSNHSFKWKIFTKKIDMPDKEKMKFQMASLILSMQYLLRDVSMIQDKTFFEVVNRLYQNESLAEKTMTTNLYQRIYRSLFTKESFDSSQRNNFTNELFPIELHESKILEWNKNPSSLYSIEESLKQIEARYKNANNATYLTIEHLKIQSGYNEWIENLKSKKWLDWQILLAIYNSTFLN